MKFNIAGVAAVVFALATAPAFALPGKGSQPFVGDGNNTAPARGPYYSGTPSAYLGDGSNAGPVPGPSYTPTSAQVGDGSNATPAPGPFYSGTASAYLGDGSSATPAPGLYYDDTGSAENGPAKYDQDSAQSREHSHSEAQY